MPSRNVLNGRADMPKVMISAEDCISAGYRFILTLEPFTFGFQSINGIKLDKDIDVLEEGGVNDHPIYVGKPERQEQTLDLERGLLLRAGSSLSSLARWGASKISNNLARRALLMGISALDPQEALETGPSIGFIDVYSPSMKLIGSYSFMSFGMKSWELSGGLDATKSEIMIERISILHHGITRRPVNALPSLFTGAAEGALGLADTVADIALAPKKLISSVVTEFNDYKEKFNTEIKDSANDLKEKFENIPDEYKDVTGAKEKQRELQEAEAAEAAEKRRAENIKAQRNAIIEQAKKVDKAKKAVADAETEEERNEALKDLKKESAELERISNAPAEDIAREIAEKTASVEDMKKKTDTERDTASDTAEQATKTARKSAAQLMENAADSTPQEKVIAEAAAKEMIADALKAEADLKDTIAQTYEEESAEADAACAAAVAEELAAQNELKEAMKSGDQTKVAEAKEKLRNATKDKEDNIAASNAAKQKADAAREEAEAASDAASDAQDEADAANDAMQNAGGSEGGNEGGEGSGEGGSEGGTD